MKVKEWLQQYGHARTELNRLTAELEELKESTARVKAIKYSAAPKSRGGARCDLSDTMVLYEQLIEKIKLQRYKQLKAMQEVKSVIDKVEDPQQRIVLTLRYIRDMQWENIAEKITYSEQMTYRIHEKALKSAGEIIERGEHTPHSKK